MALYEYYCQACDKSFEKLQPYDMRDIMSCPDCESRVDRKLSTFVIPKGNKFTKDGEGFSSVEYGKQEGRERIRANAGKYESLS